MSVVSLSEFDLELSEFGLELSEFGLTLSELVSRLVSLVSCLAFKLCMTRLVSHLAREVSIRSRIAG